MEVRRSGLWAPALSKAVGGGTSPFVFPASARRFLNQLPGAGYTRMVIASLSRNIYHSNMTCEKVWNFIGATQMLTADRKFEYCSLFRTKTTLAAWTKRKIRVRPEW